MNQQHTCVFILTKYNSQCTWRAIRVYRN